MALAWVAGLERVGLRSLGAWSPGVPAALTSIYMPAELGFRRRACIDGIPQPGAAQAACRPRPPAHLAAEWPCRPPGCASPGLPAGAKAKAAVQLLFDQPPPSQGADEPWYPALARWALTALLLRYFSSDGAAAAAEPRPSVAAVSARREEADGWRSGEARRLAARFACDSYGDALFGAAVAGLLRSDIDRELQVRCRRASGCGWTPHGRAHVFVFCWTAGLFDPS